MCLQEILLIMAHEFQWVGFRRWKQWVYGNKRDCGCLPRLERAGEEWGLLLSDKNRDNRLNLIRFGRLKVNSKNRLEC